VGRERCLSVDGFPLSTDAGARGEALAWATFPAIAASSWREREVKLFGVRVVGHDPGSAVEEVVDVDDDGLDGKLPPSGCGCLSRTIHHHAALR
jgi:hypothetical protein